MNKIYFVKLCLHIGEHEKHNNHIIHADTEAEAVKQALTNECHGEPDFSEFPEGGACWDMGEMVYKLDGIKEITQMQLDVYQNICSPWKAKMEIKELNHLWTDMNMILDGTIDGLDEHNAEATQGMVESVAKGLNVELEDTRS